MRSIVAGICGSIFSLGLVLSGMTDTKKVQGFLDVTGAWDPTLMFVMGGAIIPMAIAWQVAKRRTTSVLGGKLPAAPSTSVDRRLALGAVLFGMGWALAGFCPGPALSSLSFGSSSSLKFIFAMIVGMSVFEWRQQKA